MDNFKVRNSPALRAFIQQNPDNAREAISSWNEFASSYPDLGSITSSEQWYTWLTSHPEVKDESLWIGKEVQVVWDDLSRENPQAQTTPTQTSPAPNLGLGSALGKGIGGLGNAFIKASVLENEWDYQRVAYDLQREWRKEHGVEDFSSKEGADFLHGSLENPNGEGLDEKVRKKLAELATTNQKLAKTLARHEEQKKKTYDNLNDDPSVSLTHNNIGSEYALRLALLEKENPNATTKEREALEAKLYEKISQKAWDKFTKNHPEKTQAYSGEKHAKSNKDILSAKQRMDEKEQEKDIQKGLVDLAQAINQVEREEQENETEQEQPSSQNQPSQPEEPPVQKPPPESPPPKPPSIPRTPGSQGIGGRMLRSLGSKGGAATRAGSRAALTAGRALLMNPYVLGILILILIVVAIIVMIINGAEETKPAPPPSGPINGSIAQCEFTRGNQSTPAMKYNSSVLIGYFQEASRLSGVPASVLAGIARIESPDLVNYTNESLSSFSCATSETGALGLMQIQPRGTKGHDSGAVAKGAGYLGISYESLTKADYCDVRKSIIMGAGFINQKRVYATGSEWNPDKVNDKSYIDGVASSYYGCLKYPNCENNEGLGGGPYSYGDDLWASVSSCLVVTTTPTENISGVPVPTEKLEKILYWAQQINDQLQPGLPVDSFNKMLANITNGTYIATIRRALDRGVNSTGIYWCTNIVIDSFNLAGVEGLGPNQQGVRSMMTFWQTTPGYKYIPNTGIDALRQIKPGYAVFRKYESNYTFDHVSLVKSVSVDERGNGKIETLDSNTYKGWRSTIMGGEFTDKSFLSPIVGFGAVE